ncbi:methionyl-tRNA formyltransferase [Acutalibacter caecimuris]|uniref:methionyl-tRNA formyltransferase n=1 Tax=Acutalibacter caecimuris TaxID=3093657 RepID=UPI002AC91EF7|nr:methionyl-tRNA formyltransferase [Acutalibacter sp. M00118]
MRIVFMGTPDFAVPSLQSLIDRGHQICGVFTQPDKPKGRGHKMQPPPVKELALQFGLPVFQPATLRDSQAQDTVEELAPDVIVVVAYGKLLPPRVLGIPKWGCINVHGSLLPKYRGAAPIQWAVLNGEKTTGVTTMFMAEGMDTGDMLMKSETPVGPEETAGELFDRLKGLGAALLIETLDRLEQGGLTRIPQNHEEATQAPMLTKEMSVLNWNRPAQEVHDWIRGLNPWPCAVTALGGERVKLLGSRVIGKQGPAGTAFETGGELGIYCGQDALVITELQAGNGKRMSGKSYLLGHPLCMEP